MKLTFNALNFSNPLLSFLIRTPSNNTNNKHHQTNKLDSSIGDNQETDQQHKLDEKPPDINCKPLACATTTGQPQQVANNNNKTTPVEVSHDKSQAGVGYLQEEKLIGGCVTSTSSSLSAKLTTTDGQVTSVSSSSSGDSHKNKTSDQIETNEEDKNKRKKSQSLDKQTISCCTGDKMPSVQHQRRATTSGYPLELPELSANAAEQRPSLVDRLIDSPVEWRRLISEANGSHGISLNQIGELQIKRQEVIHELVQTERHHCLTLALMRQVYLNGLRQLNESRNFRNEPQAHHLHHLHQILTNSSSSSTNQHHAATSMAAISNSTTTTSDLIDLDRLFPALEDLIQAHELFFAHLRLRLVESCRAPPAPGHLVGLVGPLGDLLCNQFRLHQPAQQQQQHNGATGDIGVNNTKNSNNNNNNNNQQQQQQHQLVTKQQPANGNKLLQAYAKFCGQHYDSSRYYKHLMQNDKGFKQFIEQCNKLNASCRQRGIPECNLLVTQRLTKYPLLIEQLIKTSKDDQVEEQKLREALKECKTLLAELNNQLARKESFERLLDIYAQFSPKSYTIYNRHLKFTKHDLLQHKRLRQLLHSDGQVRIWSATRRKLFQVLCLILNDIVVFLKIESSSSSSTSSSAAAAQQPSNAAPTATLNHPYHLSAFEPPEQSDHLNSPPGSLMMASSPNLASSQQPPAATTAAAAPTSGGTGAAASFNIKYYFANIDNKSSVISLSKLLVREKAATDQEPRVYLISSSPRQPEMYELAFLSRRHQTSFVEKLKACVEQHNKSLALEGGHDALDLDDDDDDDDEEEEEDDDDDDDHDHDVNEDDDYVYDEDEDEASDRMDLLRLGGHDLSSGCLCDDADNDHRLYDDDDYGRGREDDDDDENCHNDNRRDSADEEEEEEHCAMTRRSHEELEGDADDEGAGCRCSEGLPCRRCNPTQVAPPQTGASKTKQPASGELDEFELDIEQDVVPEPAANLSGGSSDEPTSFAFATPEGTCDGRSLEEAAGSPRPSSSSEPEASNESGLSERAKDSLDEAAPSKQKLRANRRRRAQRPRNISNQSSSSSEAAHRQAIQLIKSTDKQQQHPPSSMSAGCAADNITSAPAAPTTTTNTIIKYEEEFDSGRGHDDSSSAASTSSNSLGSRSIVSLSNSCIQKQQQHELDADAGVHHHHHDGKCAMSGGGEGGGGKEKKGVCPIVVKTSTGQQTVGTTANEKIGGATPPTSGGSSNNNSSSCASSTVSGSTVACVSTTCGRTKGSGNAGGSNLIKCPSILSKSNCSGLIKQRKLSTVSTMSSQLKLISKLKSNFADVHSICLQCSQRQGTGSGSCNHRQQNCSGAASSSTSFEVGNHCYSCASQQSTLNKQIRQHMRRSTFIPEQKLEELRDLRIQLDKDKQEWQAKFDRMQEQLLNERRELDLAREKLKQDRQQVANEREQLYRKLDVLKAKGILLSPSHKVIITTPELRVYPPNGNSDGYINQQQQINNNNNNNNNTNSCFNGTIHLHQNQRQQQQQQMMIGQVNQMNHSSTIQIVNQQQSQPTSHRYTSNQLSPLATTVNMNSVSNSISYPTNQSNNSTSGTYNGHLAVSNRVQSRSSSSNLFVRSAGKVPLHLSEGSSALAPQTQKSSTMSLMSKVSLIGSSGGSLLAERLCGSAASTANNNNMVSGGMESHVI